MTRSEISDLNILEMNEIIFNFSIDRSEMHNLLNQFSSEQKLNRTEIEYEIQILRILGVGWSISYFVHDSLFKRILSESYWKSIKEFSNKISSISSTTMSQKFNYFDVIKERLDIYVKELNIQKNADEPAAVIGPKFAELCGHSDEAVVIWMGSKMFQFVLNQINTFLSNAKFIKNDSSLN